MDFSPLWISLKVATLATIITFVLGLVAANVVIKMNKGKAIIDGLFTLPLVLPPTVVGFFLLLLFGKNSVIGQMLSVFNINIVFTWVGAVIASTVVSFPLMYRTSRGALEQVDENLVYAARTLGKKERWIFLKVMVPIAWPGIMAGTILSFARALGEFGATIMLAGNIPGRTQTMSIAVYTAVQGGNRELAFKWVFIIVMMSFFMMMLMNYWSLTKRTVRGQEGRK